MLKEELKLEGVEFVRDAGTTYLPMNGRFKPSRLFEFSNIKAIKLLEAIESLSTKYRFSTRSFTDILKELFRVLALDAMYGVIKVDTNNGHFILIELEIAKDYLCKAEIIIGSKEVYKALEPTLIKLNKVGVTRHVLDLRDIS